MPDIRREAGRETAAQSGAAAAPGPAGCCGPTSMPAIPAAPDVLLTPLNPADAPELFALTDANRAGLRRWLPWVDGVRHVEDTLQFIVSAREEAARGGGVQYAVKAAGRIVGVIGRSSGKPAAGSVSLGYWISAAHQGRGLATASCRALITAAFKQGFDRVEIHCAEGNRQSRAVPIRLGLREDGRVLDAERLDGRLVDHVIYAVRAGDWRGAR